MLSFAFLAKKNRKSVVSNSRLRVFLIILFLFTIDQASKYGADRLLSNGESFPVVPGLLHLTRVHNTGAAFGLFQGGGLLLVALTMVSILAIGVYLTKSWHWMRQEQKLGWILVLGGALGNLCDRLIHQYVIDFIDFRVWPVFNLADSFVCVGVGLILFNAFMEDRH